ncbi:MAG: hypothetical protein WBX17_04025 [Microbacterium sp.]
MTKTVRLVGEDRDIAVVVESARELIPGDRREAWAQSVARMSRLRTDQLRRMADAGARPVRTTAVPDRSETPTLWWWAYTVGVVLAFAGAAVMLPPKGEGGQDPVLMTAVAVVCLAVGAVVLWAVYARPVPPAVRGSSVAVALAVLPVPFLLFAAVLNVIRFDALLDAVGAAMIVAIAMAGAACIGACVALYLRLRGTKPARRASSPPIDTDGAAQFATRLAVELPYARATREEWSRALAGVTIDEAAAHQARELGPFAYIVWAYFDGEFELPAVDALRTR